MKIINKKTYFLLSICLILFTIGIVHKTLENDTYFTIITGKYIANNGVNEVEPFTYHENLKFTKLRWAFDLVIWQIYNISGFDGLYIFLLIISIIIAITLFTLLIKSGNNKIISFFIVIFAMFFCKDYLKCRAQIVSYLLFIIELYYIQKLLKTNKKSYSIILIAVSYLILSFHSSVWLVYFLLYIPYLVEYLLNNLKIFKNIKFNNKFTIEKRNIKLLIITIIISIISGFITPLGTAPFTYIPKVMNGISKEFIIELQPILNVEKGFPLCVIIIILLTVFLTKTKIRVVDIFLIFGFTLMSILAERNLYIALFALAYPVARIINDFFKEYKNQNILENIDKCINNKIYPKVIILLIFICLCIFNYKEIYAEEYVDNALFPVEAAEYINQNLNVDNIRIYNGFDFGSYLEFEGIPTFLDSRSEIYTEEFNNVEILQDWVDYEIKGNRNIDFIVDKYNITHLVVYSNEDYSKYLGKYRFFKIYYDNFFTIYKVY